MEEKRGVIINAVMIILILGLAFISQQHFFDSYGKNFFSWSGHQINSSWQAAGDWAKATIYPRAQKEVEERGETLKEEVGKQKDAAAKSVWENIKNFFAEKFSNFSGTNVQ